MANRINVIDEYKHHGCMLQYKCLLPFDEFSHKLQLTWRNVVKVQA
jgi:hypothetical protein